MGKIVKICIYLVRLMTDISTQEFLCIIAYIHTEKQSNFALSYKWVCLNGIQKYSIQYCIVIYLIWQYLYQKFFIQKQGTKLHPESGKSLSRNYHGGSGENDSKIENPSQYLTLICLEHAVRRWTLEFSTKSSGL